MNRSLVLVNNTLFFRNFLLNSLVCMANGVYNKRLCFTIFIKSCNIIGLNHGSFDEFSKRLIQIEEEQSKNKQQLEINTYSDYLFFNMRTVQKIWLQYFPEHNNFIEAGLQDLKYNINKNGFSSWPTTDAIYIWPWLHIIAIDMDMNFGLVEKYAFLDFIPDIIKCGICKTHYKQHLNELKRNLQNTTCSNVLLALHTFINNNLNLSEIKFIFNKELIIQSYVKIYQKDYFKLKSIHELL